MECMPFEKLLLSRLPDNLVFLDIETTGLNPAKGAKIIEIAMLKVRNGAEIKYESLVNPGHSIPWECSRIHSIYDSMVKSSPPFNEIAKEVVSFIGDGVVVCHNASFDLSFVLRELYQTDVFVKSIRYVDTLALAREYFSFDSNKLENIAEAVGIEVKLSHRAMADVLTLFSVAKYMFANMYKKGVYEIKTSVYEYASQMN